MATNLRLRAEAEAAVRAEAERSGRSQQDVIRVAIDRYLGIADDPPASADSGRGPSPRAPYRRPRRRVSVPAATSTLDLLDRDER